MTVEQRDPYGRTALINAVIDRKAELAEQLMAGGADVRSADTRGWTALHFAAQNQDVDLVKALVAGGADVNAVDIFGNAPLSKAVFNYVDNQDIVPFLLAHGANPDLENHHGVSSRRLSEKIANYDSKHFFK